ncbi:MAG TPA: signal peptidase I, partial [Acidimicrobiales bacterium]|nr:signal peptidase I [Acidimicrobiales bacterium]
MTPRRRGRRAPLSESALAVAVAVAVAVLVKAFVAQAFYIPSASMEPQLDVHDRVVVSRLAYDLHSPRRGDIVVFEAPAGVEKEPTIPTNPVLRVLHGAAVAIGLASARTDLIKRVIALPGETVAGRHGHVYIDGRVLMEPYLPPGTLTSDFGPVQVP